MTREIKFRAWDINKNKMFQVQKLVGNTGDSRIYADWEVFEEGKKESLRSYDKMTNDEVYLMQYTGLKDKNGKEIYEGDIVKLEGYYHSIYEVVFIRSSFVLQDSDKSKGLYVRIVMQDTYQMEIIGNIYENPELIK